MNTARYTAEGALHSSSPPLTPKPQTGEFSISPSGDRLVRLKNPGSWMAPAWYPSPNVSALGESRPCRSSPGSLVYRTRQLADFLYAGCPCDHNIISVDDHVDTLQPDHRDARSIGIDENVATID